jgi:hypothetical protein
MRRIVKKPLNGTDYYEIVDDKAPSLHRKPLDTGIMYYTKKEAIKALKDSE